jgi:hypothetical protein
MIKEYIESIPHFDHRHTRLLILLFFFFFLVGPFIYVASRPFPTTTLAVLSWSYALLSTILLWWCRNYQGIGQYLWGLSDFGSLV